MSGTRERCSQDRPVVAVAKRGQLAYSETFIRAHIERLDARLMLIDAGWLAWVLPLALHLPQALKFAMDFCMSAKWQNFLLRNNVDVVLAEFGPTGVAVQQLCQRVDIPLVVHFRGHDVYKHAIRSRLGHRYKELFASAAALIAVSREMEQQLLRLGAPREKVYYNPCGVDTALFRGANPAQAPPVFVAVGRFIAKKAPHMTLLAFQKVSKSTADASLIMIGSGPLWNFCQRLAQRLNIADVVTFLGPQPHDVVAASMQRARAFVQHSMRARDGNAEGTPLAVVEAGAAGLPVLATWHAGIPDVVIDGETGFLVEEGDIDGMAESMMRVIRSPALAARLGKAARERVCAEFSMEKSIGNLQRIIATVLPDYRRSFPS